jgi:hypothetical protein
MLMPRRTLLIVAACAVIAAAGCARAPEKLTPEAARARGDELLKEMSKNLGALQTFAYTADEQREDVKDGAKVVRKSTRRVLIRRPNAFTFTTTRDERDAAGWYDGKQVTLVSNREKIWVRGPMPPTLDEALDFLSAEYAIQMPTADLVYSSPYDAIMTPDTTGGWVDVQQIGGQPCDHLAYSQKVVDWEMWLSQTRHLPCQVKIIYKNEPGQPSVTVIYGDFDPSPQVTDATFAAKVPDGYQRIKIMRHATVEDPKAGADEPGAGKTEPPAKKQPN